VKDTRELERRLQENGDSMKVTATKPSEQYLADVMTKLYAGIFYEAASALAAQREELERLHWIPVTERLPLNDELVMIWFEWGMHEKRVAFGRRVNGHWRPEGGNGNFDDSVNWWMPLPAAPATEKEKP